MKTFLATALLLVGMMSYAQTGPRNNPYKDMTPEQVASLQTKKLALALDLTENQQELIQDIHLENAKQRQSKMEERENREGKPNADERYALMTERLDRKLEMKGQMKQILDEDQFEKWEKLHLGKEMRGRCRVHRGR